MSRWIRHPALIWTLLALFGVPNLLGQGFHVALHHSHHQSHASHCHGSVSDGGTTTKCAHSHSHVKAGSAPLKKQGCCHHRTSHTVEATAQLKSNSPALSLADAKLCHDPHDCAACQYFSTAQALIAPVESAISQDLVSPFVAPSSAAVFCERYLASSPRGPPVA